MKGFDSVVPVASAPERILWAANCPDTQDIAEVDLRDGIQLAVVLDSEMTPMGKVAQRLQAVETSVSLYLLGLILLNFLVSCSHFAHCLLQTSTLNGWQRGRVNADEEKCAEWAVSYLKDRKESGQSPNSPQINIQYMNLYMLMYLLLQGVQRFCFKRLSKEHIFDIEIDGMAYSDVSVVLVERKPCITMENIFDLEKKRKALR